MILQTAAPHMLGHILTANEILPLVGVQIPPAQLVPADPGKSRIPIRKRMLYGGVGNLRMPLGNEAAVEE